MPHVPPPSVARKSLSQTHDESGRLRGDGRIVPTRRGSEEIPARCRRKQSVGVAERLHDIVLAAAWVFGNWGLARSQMHDVAREVGVAPGTLYLYVQSKESLFDLALRYGMGMDLTVLHDLDLPHQVDKDTIIATVRSRGDLKQLLPGLAGRVPASVAAADVMSRLCELYDMLAAHRFAVRMVERSAREWAELANVFFHDVREPLVKALASYLQRAELNHEIMLPGDPMTTSRLLTEYASWSAIHRHFDGADCAINADDDFRATTILMFQRSITNNGSL